MTQGMVEYDDGLIVMALLGEDAIVLNNPTGRVGVEILIGPDSAIRAVRKLVEQDKVAMGLALLSALWCRYCFGTGEHHEEIPENDPAWERLVETSKEARSRPEAWLEMICPILT